MKLSASIKCMKKLPNIIENQKDTLSQSCFIEFFNDLQSN